MGRAETGPAANLVLGTAGHIDHGKTALIGALTGVDTDRLPEERERGITIELGFAPLDLADDVRVGVVDVPGHEGLVRTMVAGATGIDLVLLVVAADEGVMPQTREHLAICELLGVTRAVVALTKIDAVEAELAALAEAETRETLAETGLGNAPLIRVSARTGHGLDALRDALLAAVRTAPPRTARSGPPRLAVDRAFAARGFGAVVTGTLVGAGFRVGDAVAVLPGGARGRLRGLQRHGAPAECIEPGTRCAANLQGLDLADVPRGSVVTRPDAFEPTTSLDVALSWLDVAPSAERASVELLTGTAERRARLAPIGRKRLVPGHAGYARLHVEGEPLPVVPGDRFVVRGFAHTSMGGATLGGGVVLDATPPRLRRGDPELERGLTELASGDPARGLAVRIGRAGLAGAPREQLARESVLEAEVLNGALEQLRTAGGALVTNTDTWLDPAAAERLEAQLGAALGAFHAREPLLPGMPTGALRGALPSNVPPDVAELVLIRLAERGALHLEGDLARHPDHRPALSEAEAALAERVLARAGAAGLEPPGLREWAQEEGVPLQRLRDLLAHLEREGRLVRARDDLWFDRSTIDALRDRVVDHLRQHGSLETPAYKTLIGTSRRTAVPLMELFDAERVTVRRGAARRLRG
ncbi:MAG: selenocysteine-specific translation elongation factor [Myxococcota bacterium]|mgnify:CR=1 FL=1|nr:selenocysteine-specific translation elongation factor [Deltaproteobacteria bacterium]MCP4243561.1 selenocysteine-specific translation elongation factor [bacterium]MDP6073502.1 selenocysteine-specific translation elongation factor [Myxococcota bacterium]MDP6242850.1 selenocysteine-specific translation elongation factor [Myxococcota bacterium]MDP7076135.1 selenocysteine-specific translation elongation factor [Myxococcota bacterium]